MAFSPYSDDHAIRTVVISLAFARPLVESELLAISKLHNVFSSDLPKMETGKMTEFKADSGGNLQGETRTELGTVKFSSFKRDGSADTILDVDKFSLNIVLNSYTGWKNVLPIVLNYLEKMLLQIGEDVFLNVVALHYIDEFKWEGDESEYDIYKLVEKKKNFLPEQVNIWKKVWHNHVGYFETDQHEGTPILCRLNFDALIEKKRPIVRINTMLDFRPNNNNLSRMKNENLIDHLREILNRLHTKSKSLFGEVITTDMKQRIGLLE